GPFSAAEFMRSLVRATPALLMPIIVLGGIYTGVFTPTEAAAIAALYGIVCGYAFYRSLSFASIGPIFIVSAEMTAGILFIIAQALVVGVLATLAGIPSAIVAAVSAADLSPWQFL